MADSAMHQVPRFCVLGNPVTHSQSPFIHAAFADWAGIALDYGRQEAPLDGFAQTLALLKADAAFQGCNVTVPFKFEAFAQADEASPQAELAQAANTLQFLPGRKIFAHNTDGAGLVHDITQGASVALAGRNVLLLGAGGAAAGVLGPLLDASPRLLVLTNRNREKAEALAARHRPFLLSNSELLVQDLYGLKVDLMPEFEGFFDVVINATASSLEGAAVPVSSRVLKSGTLALDMMYGPAAAGFMQWAHGAGANPRDGLGMLVAQAASAFGLWHGITPHAAATAGVLAALRQRLSVMSDSP